MNESVEETYKKNRDVILNRAKDYYKMTRKDYESNQEINTETYLKKKNEKQKYGRNTYMSEEKKQRLKEYQKNYCEIKKLK